MHEKIIQWYIEEIEKDDRILLIDEYDENESILFNKDNDDEIWFLIHWYLYWYSFKMDRYHQFSDLELLIYAIWIWQMKEMHDKYASLREGYVWKYLWKNWYKLDQWKFWIRSAHLDHYSIIQINVIIEVYWSVLKYHGLRWFHRSCLDHFYIILYE